MISRITSTIGKLWAWDFHLEGETERWKGGEQGRKERKKTEKMEVGKEVEDGGRRQHTSCIWETIVPQLMYELISNILVICFMVHLIMICPDEDECLLSKHHRIVVQCAHLFNICGTKLQNPK